MMSNPLVKSLGFTAAILAVYALTFGVLFTLNRDKFQAILAKPVKRGLTPAQLASVEHRQFIYWNFRTTEINKMIKDLAEEREALKTHEADLASREARVTSEQKENERIRGEIERSKKELSDYIVQIKGGEVARIKEEVVILNNMAPESAVAIMGQKSDAEIVKILSQMKPDAVAQILEAMLAQPAADGSADGSKKRVATILELMKRLREEATK